MRWMGIIIKVNYEQIDKKLEKYIFKAKINM